jgi:hypothetical protein
MAGIRTKRDVLDEKFFAAHMRMLAKVEMGDPSIEDTAEHRRCQALAHQWSRRPSTIQILGREQHVCIRPMKSAVRFSHRLVRCPSIPNGNSGDSRAWSTLTRPAIRSALFVGQHNFVDQQGAKHMSQHCALPMLA